MTRARIAHLGLLMALMLVPVSAHEVKAQSPRVPAVEMSAFRACLAAAQTREEGQACDAPLYEACNAKMDAPDTTVAMIACTAMQTNAWDIMLNEVWPQTLADLTPTAQTKLRAAQRIWITLRKADCEAVYEANIGGTIRGPAYGACMVQMTKDRYFWIKDFVGP